MSPVTINDFLGKMVFELHSGKGIYMPEGKHPNPKWGYWGKWTRWNDALWQPHCLIFGAALPEPIYYNVVDYMCGTTGLWWDYTKIREGMAASPASRMHGEILGRQSFQRKDAKEMLATVQTMKTVILNLESDLEKIREQRDAFYNKNAEQIKGLFVDNYGGPSRSWSSLAHQVPIVKSALTWFYRLEEKSPDVLKLKKGEKESDGDFESRWKLACQKDMEAQVDAFVKESELNPAVANYMKRKIQEYWTWRSNYSTFINKTYNSVIQNLRQQRANMQLYMKWAQRNIREAENMLIPFDEVDEIYGMFAEEFPQFAPLMYTVTDMFYDPERKWPIVIDRLKPWVPAIAIQLLMSYNPDVHGNKYVRGFNVMSYGIITSKNKWELKNKIAKEKASFLDAMKTYGGFGDEELMSLGLTETSEEKMANRYEEAKYELRKLTGSGFGSDDSVHSQEAFEELAVQKQDIKENNKDKIAALQAEIKTIGQKIGVEQVSDKNASVKDANKSIMAELEKWFKPIKTKDKDLYNQAWDYREKMMDTLSPMLAFLGGEIKGGLVDTRKRRASWFAYNTFFKVYHGLKSANGWMDYM